MLGMNSISRNCAALCYWVIECRPVIGTSTRVLYFVLTVKYDLEYSSTRVLVLHWSSIALI